MTHLATAAERQSWRGVSARAFEELPGPRGDLFFGSLREYRKDKVVLLLRTMQQYGDLAALHIGRQRVLLVSDPATVVDVLVHRPLDFRPSASYRHLERLIGAGLVTTNGDVWLRHRTALQPLFRASALSHVEHVAVRETERLITAWRAASVRTIDLHAQMRALAMEITAAVLFGDRPRGDVARFRAAFDSAHAYVMQRLESFVPFASPLATRRFERAKWQLDEDIAAMLAGPASRSDESLVAKMRTSVAAGGPAFTDVELRDETLTLLLAGFETTAAALTWLLFLVSRHDDARARIEGGDAAYAASVVQEALRLFPPVWAFSREVARATDIAGCSIPAGTKIAISPYCIHRNPRAWTDPEEFRPERFDRAATSPPPPGAYLPFGLGARQCVGRAFALLVLQHVLTTIVAHCRLRVQKDVPPFRAGVFLTPKAGLSAEVTLR